MDSTWTAEQRALRERVLEFATEELNHNLASRDRDSIFVRENWNKCAAFGVLGACVPQAYGGRGYDVVTTMILLEALGQGCRDNGLTLALNGQMWSIQEPILRFGSEEQKKRFLPRLCSGAWLGAHGMTEPGSGSDAFSLQTSAVPSAGGYILNGHKSYIGLAPEADVSLVFAKTDPGLGAWGISVFLIERGTKGLHQPPARPKMGLRTAPLGDLILEDCFVPEENRLGPEGVGMSLFNASMDWERSFIFASHVGSMARQLEQCIEYARTRSQFGQPIGSFQSVSNRIAEMRLRLETSRLLLYKLAWMKQRDEPAALEAALANLHLAESFAANSMDAVRIHGARGYLSEFEIERDLRDSVGGVIYSGTSDIQRNLVARLLGL